jgi:3',5'-cyclic AMP phosphodiesterase CpdA
MKKRTFIKNLVLGGPSVLLGTALLANRQNDDYPQYQYGRPGSLNEVISRENQFMLRIEVRAVSSVEPVEAVLEMAVSRGKTERVKHYFFKPGMQVLDRSGGSIRALVNNVDPGVLVAWIGSPEERTSVTLKLNGKEIRFTLAELVSQHEIRLESGEVQVTANYLLDREIAFLTPEQMGIKLPADTGKYTIAILADTQGGMPGVPGSSDTRIKIHNAFIEDSISITNNLDPQPLFTLILGDVVDAQGEKEHFSVMHRLFERLRSPVLYAMGNHESIYRSVFSPGYRMDDFNNYYAAQKAINGMEELLYSFNIGKWHFIVWPDPLRHEFWETHPHYFDWLEQDLEKHRDYPVMFMQHIPIHPIGIDPLINYAESVAVKRLLADIIARHGNVKYVFSGHVHIPVRSSFKTAVNYKGMKMINLPAAGYRPRGFGEEDWHGGPSQGVLVADIEGDRADVYFKTVTEEIYPYPDNLRGFDEKKYPLWYSHKWELPARNQIQNGDFSKGLEGWSRRFVYQESENPSNIMEVRKVVRERSMSALYVRSRKRGYPAPGQDRLPQNINHLCQTVNVDGIPGILKFDYRIDGNNTDMGRFCGAFVWAEGFRKGFQVLNLAYWVGFSEVNIGGGHSRVGVVTPGHFHLDETADVWHSATINLEKDAGHYGKTISELKVDKVAINVGTWNINDAVPVSFAAWFGMFRLEPYNPAVQSNVDGRPVQETPPEKKWWRNKYEQFANIAGEHRLMKATGEYGWKYEPL